MNAHIPDMSVFPSLNMISDNKKTCTPIQCAGLLRQSHSVYSSVLGASSGAAVSSSAKSAWVASSVGWATGPSTMGAVVHDDGVAGGLQLGNAVVVGLDGGAGGVDALAGGHIGPVGGCALLGVIELAQLDVSLLNGVLLAQIGGLQLGDLGQALGLGHTGLSQVHGAVLHVIKETHREASFILKRASILSHFCLRRKDPRRIL